MAKREDVFMRVGGRGSGGRVGARRSRVEAGAWRCLVGVLAALLAGCGGDSDSGGSVTCDPDGPNTCGSGWWCQAVSGKEYKGVCVEVGDMMSPRSCWTGDCPPGYRIHNGCRCRVPPTGVTMCRVLEEESLVDCSSIPPGSPEFGQDGHFFSGSLLVTDLGDGTAKDERTGLIWQKEAEVSGMTWETAYQYCRDNLAGLPGNPWVLPNAFALLSLVDYSKGCPMWHAVFGTECPPESRFWTSTKHAWSSLSAFFVGFGYDGRVDYDRVGDLYGVRCVRGLPSVEDKSRFVQLRETVFDRLTGLEWEKFPSKTYATWAEALTICFGKESLWRLPNIKELYSIVSVEGSACDWPEGLQGPCSTYWSSTPAPWSSSSAFCVDFDDGGVDSCAVDDSGPAVRCVRAEQ